MKAIWFLEPVCKDYIWGGQNLKTKWGKRTTLDTVAESWELSAHKDGASRIRGGALDGAVFSETVTPEDIGSGAQSGDSFPILVKLIDAQDNLSVQVHPGDAYARLHEGDAGKTEMWYIADCVPGAGIYYGFKRQTDPAEFRKSLTDGRVESLLRFVPVQKGDTFFIPAGTVHAILKGVTVCEVQQSSNVTYRVYDYGRTGADGKPRPLHIDKAMEVIDFAPAPPQPQREGAVLVRCPYFTAEHHSVTDALTLTAGRESFCAVTVLEGEGKADGRAFVKGDTFFVPAGYGDFTVEGQCAFLAARWK